MSEPVEMLAASALSSYRMGDKDIESRIRSSSQRARRGTYHSAEMTRIAPSHRQPYRWIVWSTVVITLVGLIGAGASLSVIDRSLVEAAGQRLAQAADDSATMLETLLEERYGDLSVLARSQVVRTGDPTAITAHLGFMQTTFRVYSALLMADADGRVMAGTKPGRTGHNVAGTRWFQAAKGSSNVVLLDARPSAEDGGMTAVTFAVPVHRGDGTFRGVVAGWVDLTRLSDVLEQTVSVLQEQWGTDTLIEYILMSEVGEVLADSMLRQEGQVNLLALGLPSAVAVGQSPTGFIEEHHGRRNLRVITGYAKAKGGPHQLNVNWAVLVRVELASVRAPITALLWKLGVGAFSLALPMIALLLWSAKRLERYGNQQSVRATSSEEALHLHIASLRSLVEAARCLTEMQDVEEMFQMLLAIARKDTGAEAAVVGLLEESGRGVTRAIAHGVSRETLAAVEESPIWKVILDRLRHEADPIRLADLSHHLAALGFPGPAPVVSAFLGTPIRAHGRLFGTLCLMNKHAPDGRAVQFTDLDEQVVVALAAQAGVAIENLHAFAQAKRQATHDSLTGLLNHSAIMEELEKELARAHRTGEPLSVVIADLDHFKAVNDTYGHGAGDLVLVETADRIRGVVRPYDLMGRIGGEEFLLVLPKCGPAGAAHLAERLRRAIGEVPFTRAAGSFAVTASLGLTTWPGTSPTSPKILVEVADEALYRAKRHGRNRLEVETPRIGMVPDQLAG